jgi:PASTA domain
MKRLFGSVAASIALGAGALVVVPVAAGASPANDDFASAEAIVGDFGTVAGTNAEATAEANEPDHAGSPAQASVWYHWTPSADGTATLDTCTASYDTRLAVYTGNALADLSEVASNDDSDNCGTGSAQSSVTFVARAGTTYQIAVDGFGGATGTFTLAWALAPLPPTNTVRPLVTGSPDDGETLSATPGAWTSTGAVSYSYQWQRCGGTPRNVALGKAAYASQEIPGNEASMAVDGSPWTYWNSGDYPPQWIAIDLGAPYPLSAIRALITQLPDGVTTHSLLTAGPNPLDEFQLLTTFSGFTVDQQVLEHAGPPDEVEFVLIETTASPSWVAWREVQALSTCADIPGATGATYTLTPADVAATVRAVVKATNSTGSTAASSVRTPAIAPLAPINLTLPTIGGSARHRQMLSATTGSWRGTVPISYAYRWQKCDKAGANCADIPGETDATYVVRLADGGSTLRVVVAASNSAGAATAASASTAVIPYQCVVPNLKRKTVPAARRRLAARRCRLGSVKQRYSSRVARGRIISQRPRPGTELADRGRVAVLVSRGRHR